MRIKQIVQKIAIIVALQMICSIQAFALDAQQVESIVTVNQSNQLECPQHPELVALLMKGNAQKDGDITCKIPGPGGAQLTYYIPAESVKQAEIILTQANQQITSNTTGDKTSAENILNEISDKNNIAPNYTDAAAILQPAVPYVNIGLGLVTTAVVLAMQILTAFDLFYIQIPTVRNFMSDKAAEGNQIVGKKDGNGGVKLRFISDDAQFAVEQATNNPGTSPWGMYCKKRLVSYIFLAVAIVILLTGNITIITNLAIKLVSGLMSVLQGLTG